MQSKSQHEHKSVLTLAKHKRGNRSGRVAPCQNKLNGLYTCGSVWVCVSGRGRNRRATCNMCHCERPDAIGKAASQPACEGSETKKPATVKKQADRKQFHKLLQAKLKGVRNAA